MIGEGANLGVTQRARIEFAAARRAHQHRLHRQLGGRQHLRPGGQHQDRAGAGGALGQARPGRAQQAARRHDRGRGRRLAAQQLPAVAGAEPGRAEKRGRACRLHGADAGAGGGQAARSHAGGTAERHGAAGAGACRPRPHPAGACRAAELRQDRPAARAAGEPRAGRARARALAHRLLPAAAARALCRRYRQAQPAPRDHRARAHQRHRQPRRPRHGGAAGRRDAPHQRRCRLRVPCCARGVRAAGAVAAHRCARRQGQGRCPARPLSGDAGARERADAVVPAQRRGAVRSRRHHRPASRRASGAAICACRTSCRTAARPSSSARRAGWRRAAFLPTSPPISPPSMCWGWRRRSPRSPRRRARPCRRRPARISTIGEHLRIADLAAKANAIATPDYYDRLAVAQALAQLDDAQAVFTRQALRADADGIEAWLAGQGDRLARVRGTLEEIAADKTCTVSRLLVAAGQLNDLAAEASAAPSASARRGRAAGRAKSAASGSPSARKPARRPRS